MAPLLRRAATAAAVAILLVISPPTAGASDEAGDEAALRELSSANGLLNRGLYELAAKEYRQFLAEHASDEKAPIARYGLAVCLFRTGELEGAAGELDDLLAADDFQYAAEVRAMLGQCRLVTGDPGRAVEPLRDLLRRHKTHALADDATAMLVEAYYQSGEHEKALTQCQQFEKRWPENPLRERVWFFGGLAELARSRPEAAADQFSRLLEAFPKSAFAEQAGLLLAQCRHEQGALDDAVRWYRTVLKNAEGAYAADAMFGLATLLHNRGEFEDAGALLDQFLKQFPDNPKSTSAALLRGRSWFELGDYEKAAAFFERAAESTGDSADDGAYWLAKCRLRQEAFGEAAQRLKAALERYPESELAAEMQYDRAVALARGGRDADAGKVLNEFLSRYPDHALFPDGQALLATIQHRRGDYEPSLKRCGEFLSRFPKHELAQSVRFLAAENEFLLQKYERAARAYATYLESADAGPNADRARFRMALSLFHLDRFEEALPALRESAKLAASDASFASCDLALGEIYFQREEWRPAEEHFAAYLGRDATVASAADATLKLGIAKQRQGRHAEARRTFEQLLSEFTQSEHGQQRLHAMFELGQSLVALGVLDEAADVFERLLGEGADSRFTPFALNHLGAIALKRGRPGEADKYFARLIDAAPDGDLAGEALYQRGEALMATQDYDNARSVFSAFIEKHGDDPHAPRARARLATALARLDDPKRALHVIDQVEREHLSKLDESTRHALQSEKAWCLRKLDRIDEAAAAYRVLTERGGSDALTAYALVELAELEAGRKNYDEAVNLLEKLRLLENAADARISADMRAQALYRLGVCQFELKRAAPATAALEAFLTEFPTHDLAASASYFCGEAYIAIGKHQQAAEHLSRVAADFRDSDVYAVSLLRLGDCLAALQRWARCEEVFGDYLEHNPDGEQWYQARFGVGWARENQQRYDEAITAYRAVVDRHKGETAARAQFQIGECLFAQKKLDDAVRELLKVDILYAYPEWSAAALFEAGRCFEQMGKAVEASQQYHAVSEKYPESRWAKLATQRMAAVSGGALPGRDKPSQ